ncbi:hypothetical protein [Persicobacter diffluens]|uniref:DUF4468 domain-containing protein n=1 Tax=Persicobacter diffluens TaxID=981 RepID=A0AAN5AKW3_9BACT|nr:hypothetical protein PEDI_31410 [Persicobacter diffluens]
MKTIFLIFLLISNISYADNQATTPYNATVVINRQSVNCIALEVAMEKASAEKAFKAFMKKEMGIKVRTKSGKLTSKKFQFTQVSKHDLQLTGHIDGRIEGSTLHLLIQNDELMNFTDAGVNPIETAIFMEVLEDFGRFTEYLMVQEELIKLEATSKNQKEIYQSNKKAINTIKRHEQYRQGGLKPSTRDQKYDDNINRKAALEHLKVLDEENKRIKKDLKILKSQIKEKKQALEAFQ